MKPTETKSDLDILWGATAIGEAINANRRKAFYLLEGGFIPGKRVAGRWVAVRGELLAAISSLPRDVA